MKITSISETLSRKRGVDRLRVDNCILQAFEDLGIFCMRYKHEKNSNLEHVSDDIVRRVEKSMGIIRYIKGEWRERVENPSCKNSEYFIQSKYLDMYDEMMEYLEKVCDSWKNNNFDEGLRVITKCRSKIKYANYKLNRTVRKCYRESEILSSINKIKKFTKGEVLSYKIYDVSDKEAKGTMYEVDKIFEKSIANLGWSDSKINDRKKWQICLCGGGGFYVDRSYSYIHDLGIRIPIISVEECSACNKSAGVRGLREQKESTRRSSSNDPGYREHMREIFGGEQFHPDML